MNSAAGFILKYCNLECPRAQPQINDLVKNLEVALSKIKLNETLQKNFQKVHIHHLPKIGIAGCPNGCSQPQIKDIGIVGYFTPRISLDKCSECSICINKCIENAISFSEEIKINYNECLNCGDCIKGCPTGSIESTEIGWNFYLGGKLGRHPRFGKLFNHTQDNNEIVEWIIELLQNYIDNSSDNERFSKFIEKTYLY